MDDIIEQFSLPLNTTSVVTSSLMLQFSNIKSEFTVTSLNDVNTTFFISIVSFACALKFSCVNYSSLSITNLISNKLESLTPPRASHIESEVNTKFVPGG